jgi:magnesium-transporting ATPase (P-type)
MTMEQRDGKIFDLKPEMTLPMKLAASFAITYYGLLLLFAIITVVFSQYYIDSYYYNEANAKQDTTELITPILQLALLITLVFSLIQIFRKKNQGKAIFVLASILLIIFQLVTTGFVPWMKYALEALMVLIIAPIRVKKKIKLKDGKIKLETIEKQEEKAEGDEASAIQPTES